MTKRHILESTWFLRDRPQDIEQISAYFKTELTIGTDSHRQGSRRRIFATAICPEPDERSRLYYWSRTPVPRKDIPNIHVQIFMEAQQSVDVANFILANNPYLIASDITVHVDCSPEGSINRTGKCAKSVENFVRSYGYNCVIKPKAPEMPFPWAASAVADRHAR